MTKDEVRAEAARRLRVMREEEQASQSQSIQKRLIHADFLKDVEAMGCYLSWRGEVATDRIVSHVLDGGKHLAAPKFFPEENVWKHALLSHPEEVTCNEWGVPEPASDHVIKGDDLDVIIVPGQAFDTSGQRIGRGQGHYDALLSGFKGLKVGLAFDFQVFATLPAESHDIPMDYLVTSDRIYACRA